MLYNCYPIYYFISYHNLDHQLNNYFIFIIIMRIYLYHTYLIFFDFIHHNNLFISSHGIFLLRDYFIIIIIDVKEIHFINLYFYYFLYSQYFLYFLYCQGNLKEVTMVIIKSIVTIIVFIIYLLIINFYFVQIILSLIQNFVVINF